MNHEFVPVNVKKMHFKGYFNLVRYKIPNFCKNVMSNAHPPSKCNNHLKER